MPGRSEVVDVDGGVPLVEHRVGSGVLRFSGSASYALSVPQPGEPTPMKVVIDQGLVWARLTGGPPLQIRHGRTLVRTGGARLLLEAGPGGDGLLVVLDGTVDVATATEAGRTLSAGSAVQLSRSGGLIEVDGISDAELAEDPWASTNVRLDSAPRPGPATAEPPVEPEPPAEPEPWDESPPVLPEGPEQPVEPEPAEPEPEPEPVEAEPLREPELVEPEPAGPLVEAGQPETSGADEPVGYDGLFDPYEPASTGATAASDAPAEPVEAEAAAPRAFPRVGALPVELPWADDEGPAEKQPARRGLVVAGLLALGALLIGGAILFALNRHDSKSKAIKTTGLSRPPVTTAAPTTRRKARPTTTRPAPTTGTPRTTAPPTTGAPRTTAPPRTVPTTGAPPPTTRPITGQLTGCRQAQPGRLVVSGRVSDPLGKAKAFRVRAAIVGASGSVLAPGENLVPAGRGRASTGWMVAISAPNDLAGSGASCRLISIDAIG